MTKIDISLYFLDEGREYIATIYFDADESHWDKNPTAYEIETVEINNSSTLKLKLTEGGGAAVCFIPIEE